MGFLRKKKWKIKQQNLFIYCLLHKIYSSNMFIAYNTRFTGHVVGNLYDYGTSACERNDIKRVNEKLLN